MCLIYGNCTSLICLQTVLVPNDLEPILLERVTKIWAFIILQWRRWPSSSSPMDRAVWVRYLSKWVAWILSAILRFLQHSIIIIALISYYNDAEMIKIGHLVLKLWQCKVVNAKKCHFEKSPNKVFSPDWRAACFKHILMTLCVCVTSVFFWCRKDWINWFRWKVKIDTWHPLWESGCTQKMRLISVRRVTF